jgi:23S rRNA (guanine2445-N2)-methyltransferase / 23S rRNA (guanine2069-N7)-methyltransferase
MDAAELSFFATCPKGMEELLAGELCALGAGAAPAQRAGVSFVGPLSLAYRVCLWSRLASRILLPLTSFAAGDPQQLYEAVRRVDWSSHLEPDGTLAVEVAAARPPKGLAHSHFVAQRVKDAVVDQFRERCGRRPSVDVHRPDVRLNLYQRGEAATLSIDLSGESLHRRGYRREGAQTEAPLKENLAAAILTRAGWTEMIAAGAAETPADAGTAAEVARAAEAGTAALAGIPALLDPLCGSGTLLIEGAWMAADVAPGLLRAAEGRFGFIGWKRHDPELWEGLAAEARERRAAGLARLRAARAQAGGRQLFVGCWRGTPPTVRSSRW